MAYESPKQSHSPSPFAGSSLEDNFESEYDEGAPRMQITSHIPSIQTDFTQMCPNLAHTSGQSSPMAPLSRPEHSMSSSQIPNGSKLHFLRSTLRLASKAFKTHTPSPHQNLMVTPITTLSTSSPLAQFSPIPRAASVLASFGVPNTIGPRPNPGRKMLPAWNDYGCKDHEGRVGQIPFFTRQSSNVPSISRAHVVPILQSPTQRDCVSIGCLKTESVDDARAIVPGVPLSGTPRPVFATDSETHATASLPFSLYDLDNIDEEEEGCTSNASNTSSTVVASSLGTSADSFLIVPLIPRRCRPRRVSLPRLQAADAIIPSLAEVEASSRLMKGHISCASCKKVGPDFPRCPRCFESWCSRECRLTATEGTKHRCPSS